MSNSTLSSTTDSWEYDTTLAIAVALLWWASEYCSYASQHHIRYAADWNRAWSALSCLFIFTAITTALLEQFLRLRGASSPSTIATVITASVSYVIVQERLRMFDRGAAIVQSILCADKARFGRIGSKKSPKFVIEARRFHRGSHDRSGWNEVPTPRRPDEQIQVDWALDHRLGQLDDEEVAAAMRRGGGKLQAIIGSLLYSWLPTQTFPHLQVPPRLRGRKTLQKGYRGTRGRRIGCLEDSIPFSDWISQVSTNSQIFQLLATEYPSPTSALVSALSELVKDAESPEQLAAKFMELWDDEIELARASSRARVPVLAPSGT